MININNLQANIEETQILKGIDLEIKAGEVHAIMGPNGSGKSTLANVIAGRPEYSVTEGSVTFQDKELLDMEPEDRAREGVFLAFQYPTELPGVRAWQFLKAAADSIRVHNGEEEYSAREFDQKLKEIEEEIERAGREQGDFEVREALMTKAKHFFVHGKRDLALSTLEEVMTKTVGVGARLETILYSCRWCTTSRRWNSPKPRPLLRWGRLSWRKGATGNAATS